MKTSIEIKIRSYHMDQFNHVNNARYLEFIEEAGWTYAEQNNLLAHYHSLGIFHVIANINIDYIHSAHSGDVLRIESDLHGRSDASITMNHQIFNTSSGRLITEAKVTSVYLDQTTNAVVPVDRRFFSFWPDLLKLGKGTSNG